MNQVVTEVRQQRLALGRLRDRGPDPDAEQARLRAEELLAWWKVRVLDATDLDDAELRRRDELMEGPSDEAVEAIILWAVASSTRSDAAGDPNAS
jgi:hypothetical protein